MSGDMIKITVKLLAFFREVIKKSKIEIELEEGSNIFQLLESLCKLYNLREIIFDEKHEIREWVKILKNGRDIDFLDGIRTKLGYGDEIALFPPLAGGILSVRCKIVVL